MKQGLSMLVAALVGILLAGCSSVALRPDLERLYAKSRLTVDQPPVVVVHGVLGAKLRDRETGEEMWPGGARRLAFSEFRELALAIDPDTLAPRPDALEPYAIFDTIVGQDFYGEILKTLSGPGGYVRGELGRPPQNRGKQYYVFLYDWRRDNIESIRALDATIERIRRDYGRPDLEVDVVAHSNGGLIARYYARYGTQDLLDGNDFPVTQEGARKIRRLILLGTPNFGSVQSVIGLIEGSAVGLRRIPPEVLVTFPTAYQLFPHALNDWLVTPAGKPLDRDVFDVDIWRAFQWAVFDPAVRARVIEQHGEAHLALLERYMAKYLERARRFTWALSVKEPTRGVRPIVLGGDCELTPARLVVENVGDDSILRLWPKEIAVPVPGVDYDALMLEPGDGTVTKASLLARESVDPTVPRHEYSHFPLDYSFFLCERHDRLTGNVSFQDNLLHALLSVDR